MKGALELSNLGITLAGFRCVRRSESAAEAVPEKGTTALRKVCSMGQKAVAVQNRLDLAIP